jgi:pimeloyl-ACP methyl ester carboxylesterase
MPLLAPHVHVAAYDRAGMGGSAPVPDLVTINRQIDDLALVIVGLTAEPCVLAGHSWGGILVQLLAFRRQDLAAGLVLVDPTRAVGTTLLTVKLVVSDATNGFGTALRREAAKRPHPS